MPDMKSKNLYEIFAILHKNFNFTVEKPLVECSFITEFEDHIFVTVDADAFFFLHDLITSYLKEKEKVVISQVARSGSPSLSVAGGGNQTSGNNLETSTTNIGASTLSMASDTLSVSSSQHMSAGVGAMGSNKNLTNLSGASSTSNININSAEDLRHAVGNKKIAASKAAGASASVDKADSELSLRMDWRNFNCKTWHLEPTIR